MQSTTLQQQKEFRINPPPSPSKRFIPVRQSLCLSKLVVEGTGNHSICEWNTSQSEFELIYKYICVEQKRALFCIISF